MTHLKVFDCSIFKIKNKGQFYQELVKENSGDGKKLFRVLGRSPTSTLPSCTDEKSLANRFGTFFVKSPLVFHIPEIIVATSPLWEMGIKVSDSKPIKCAAYSSDRKAVQCLEMHDCIIFIFSFTAKVCILQNWELHEIASKSHTW